MTTKLADRHHRTPGLTHTKQRKARFIHSPLIGGNGNVAVVEPLTDPLPIAREINRIGVNVNQITH